MSLTHKQIAEMTCTEVNIAIAKRLAYPDFDGYPEYCHNWSHAGLLLDELVNSSKDITFLIDHWFYTDQNTGEMYPAYAVNKTYAFHEDDYEWLRSCKVRQQGHTLTEAIARTWLEWWEVKNAERNEVTHK